MGRNASGVYTRDGGIYTGSDIYEQEFSSGDFINYQSHDAEHNDIAAEITDSFSRSGKGAALADLSMGGFNLKNLGTPINDNDAVKKSYVDPEAIAPYIPTLRGRSTTDPLHDVSLSFVVNYGTYFYKEGSYVVFYFRAFIEGPGSVGGYVVATLPIPPILQAVGSGRAFGNIPVAAWVNTGALDEYKLELSGPSDGFGSSNFIIMAMVRYRWR